MTAAERAEYKALDRIGRIQMTSRLKKERAAGKVPLEPVAEPATRRNPGGGSAPKPVSQLGPAEIRGELRLLMERYGYDPLEALIKARTAKGKGRMSAKDAMALDRFLVPYVTPTLKSVDLQQDLKMSVNVSVTSFRDATALDVAVPAMRRVSAAEYEEFLGQEDDAALLADPEGGAE